MTDDDSYRYHQMMVEQSKGTLALLVANVRKNGDQTDDFVFLVVDTTGPGERAFATHLNPKFDPADAQFFRAERTADLARLLRSVEGFDNVADDIEKPRQPGTIRVLAFGKNRASKFDMPTPGFTGKRGTA